MAFFKFLFYALFYLLIKIGDAVYFGFEIFLSLPNLIKKRSSKKRRYKKREEFLIHAKSNPAATKTIGHKAVIAFGFLSSNARLIFRLIKKSILIIAKVVLQIIKILTLPFQIPGKLFRIRLRHRKRGRPRLPIKTPALYRLKYLFIGGIFAFIFLFLPLAFFIFISDLPKLSNISVNYISKTTKIFDRNGTLLFEIYGNQNRTIVALDQIPIALRQATIAIEDKDFYKHSGFDLSAIARALYVDVTKDNLQGGSTITQQLIKSALLTPEISITRKARELVLAFWAEQEYSKDEILELYFNYVPYGGTAWGIEAASQIYFGKSVSSLNLAESAYLAGLPQAPTQYSPYYENGSLGKRRQREVLKAMVAEGYITRQQADEAAKIPLDFKPQHVPIKAPHFVMYVKDLLVRKYGLPVVERGGLQVTTTLDLSMQETAEQIVKDQVEKDSSLGIGNGASLVTNPQNGDILAMVGSRDYFDLENDGNVNIATSLRQPGSTIKLVTYALALEEGVTEATIIEDRPLTIRNPGAAPYTPVNYDGKYHGRVPVRLALANSFNIPAVRLAQKFGVEKIVEQGKKMGINSWGEAKNYGVSITLGAAEVSMVELATVYGVVANGGKRVDLDPIIKVVNSEGNILQEKNAQGKQVVDPAVAYILSDILSDNRARSMAFGPNTPLEIPGRKVSVKTGTTDNKRDNWTVGYTQDLLVVTWVGNNDNTPLSPALASGITGAAPMWNRIMTTFLGNKDEVQIQTPENVIAKQCYGYTAYFVKGTEQDNCRFTTPSPTFQIQ